VHLFLRKLPLGELWAISYGLKLVPTLAISPNSLHWLSVGPRLESSGLDARWVTASKLGTATKRIECNPVLPHETALPRKTVVLITTFLPCRCQGSSLLEGQYGNRRTGKWSYKDLAEGCPPGHCRTSGSHLSLIFLEALHECVSRDLTQPVIGDCL